MKEGTITLHALVEEGTVGTPNSSQMGGSVPSPKGVHIYICILIYIYICIDVYVELACNSVTRVYRACAQFVVRAACFPHSCCTMSHTLESLAEHGQRSVANCAVQPLRYVSVASALVSAERALPREIMSQQFWKW